MSRNRLFVIASALAVPALVAMVFGVSLLNRNIGSYIASHYQ
ncbi:hypothetical protein MSHO_50530 [Mycobacterium shottsii]|uniref:Uncharacterized protein n=1 Tax=Mycobacterium shottsii TaxID=133549 RepID=A0A7I7LIQ9_9MYCO|nr:hypothetical protein MSHO_50530 [Mycobacterium shottsii]